MEDTQVITTQQDDDRNVVFMKKLNSSEFFLKEGEPPRPVLYDINLLFKKGQIWGITGNNLYEMKLLAEIMANIKYYHGGKVVLVNRGMMRRKRLILPHVFYIGSSDMIYKNMNVLEYLMFATANLPGDKIDHQEKLLEYLISIGLKRICLSPIYALTREQQAVILLLVAAYSDSQLIVLNVPDYEFDVVLIQAIKHISELIKERDKTLVITTNIIDLIDNVCSHILYLLNGTVLYQGEVWEFCQKYDRVVLVVQDRKATELAGQLKKLFPEYEYEQHGKILSIRSPEIEQDNNIDEVYKKIIELGYTPERIEINSKKMKNACEEIEKNNDLQEQLF